MRTLRAYGVGLLGAALAPALLAWMLGTTLSFLSKEVFTPAGLGAALVDALLFALPALFVAAAHALLLGLPGFLLLHRLGKASALATSILGFIIGLVPFAIYAFPRTRPGWSSGGWMWGAVREFYVNGVPTAWEWVSYAQSVAMFGFFGLCGALAFWLQWRRYGA